MIKRITRCCTTDCTQAALDMDLHDCGSMPTQQQPQVSSLTSKCPNSWPQGGLTGLTFQQKALLEQLKCLALLPQLQTYVASSKTQLDDLGLSETSTPQVYPYRYRHMHIVKMKQRFRYI